MRTLLLLLTCLCLSLAAYAQVDENYEIQKSGGAVPPDTIKNNPAKTADSTRATPSSGKTPKMMTLAKQPDSTGRMDTTRKESYWGRPQKAALYSALLPGAGQVYNREIWKVPIVYAAGGTLAAFWVYLNRQYYPVQHEIEYRANHTVPTGQPYPIGDTKFSLNTTTQLISARDYYRRNRDFVIILSGVAYLLQIADAHVFAHLKNFNVNESLTLRPTVLPVPSFAVAGGVPVTAGFNLTYRLK